MENKKNWRLVSTVLIGFLGTALIGGYGLVQAQTMHKSTVGAGGGGYIPQRVYNSNEKRFTDFEVMMLELSRSEVIFVGERHDDPATHKLERAILEGLARRRSHSGQNAKLVVSLEMFERDVQPLVDGYLAGRISEEEFLKNARPWPNYVADYRPLVEFARAHHWPVLASNVPRRLASQISKQGLASIETGPEADRKFIAAQIQCPIDDYFKRFAQAMGRHPSGDGKQAGEEKQEEKAASAEQNAMIEKFYFAQCIKDETMAETISAQAQTDNLQNKSLIVHFNGSFHSDYRLGTAARVARRLPKSNVKVISIIPLENLDEIKVDEYKKRGDYIIFTLQTEKNKQD